MQNILTRLEDEQSKDGNGEGWRHLFEVKRNSLKACKSCKGMVMTDERGMSVRGDNGTRPLGEKLMTLLRTGRDLGTTAWCELCKEDTGREETITNMLTGNYLNIAVDRDVSGAASDMKIPRVLDLNGTDAEIQRKINEKGKYVLFSTIHHQGNATVGHYTYQIQR